MNGRGPLRVGAAQLVGQGRCQIEVAPSHRPVSVCEPLARMVFHPRNYNRSEPRTVAVNLVDRRYLPATLTPLGTRYVHSLLIIEFLVRRGCGGRMAGVCGVGPGSDDGNRRRFGKFRRRGHAIVPSPGGHSGQRRGQAIDGRWRESDLSCVVGDRITLAKAHRVLDALHRARGERLGARAAGEGGHGCLR